MNDLLMLMTDGYKLGHRVQYPEGTEYVYSNLTPRASRIDGQKEMALVGAQYFLQRYFMDIAKSSFFDQPKQKVLDHYKRRIDSYLGPENNVGIDHIGALHDLGYIPLEFAAVPEGIRIPLRMPLMTIENTHPDFFWMTNYFETLISAVLWLPCTSAATAYRYRQILNHYGKLSGVDPNFIPWQGHNFSFRGMEGLDGAILADLGHLTQFTGTDTLPTLDLIDGYYGCSGVIGGSVPATEHAVMCAGGQENELETFARLLRIYPKGILSIVSDTWSLWRVLGYILPTLKKEIMARDGKLVIRPDSGVPEDIICGDEKATDPLARKGVVECLWDLFGGTVNNKGFRDLDPHIGSIYGDSITEARAVAICERLMKKGFSTGNVVYGIGSYTYQYVTRDTHSFAVKATWAQINNEEHLLFKDPVTDDGVKKSARGRIAIVQENGSFKMIDGLHRDEHAALSKQNLIQPVWRDGIFLRTYTWDEVRKNAA